MIDERDVLERALRRFEPEPGLADRVYQRRDRKRRNQRIAAGAVGVAVFVAAIWIVTSVGSLDRTRGPAGEGETGPAVTGPAEPTPDPDAERVGFLGLAPGGSDASLPAVGDLVISFQYFCCPGRSMYVYADGRMIWKEFNIVGPGQLGYFPLPPQGADDWETGWLEQRLTPEGVELLRSELVSSGLFDEDRSFVKKTEELSIGVRRDGQMITLRAAKADDPYRATPDEAQEILRLTELLKAPEAGLPDEAWADPTIRAFVPSRYVVTILFGSSGGRTPDDPSELPAPADELLRSADVVTNGSACQMVSPTQARRINTELRDAFGDLTIPYGGIFGSPVSIESALPHQLDCSAGRG